MEVDVTSCYFCDVIFVIKENKLCRYFFSGNASYWVFSLTSARELLKPTP